MVRSAAATASTRTPRSEALLAVDLHLHLRLPERLGGVEVDEAGLGLEHADHPAARTLELGDLGPRRIRLNGVCRKPPPPIRLMFCTLTRVPGKAASRSAHVVA